MKRKRFSKDSPESCCTAERMQLIQSHSRDICKTRHFLVTSLSRTVPALVTH